MRRTLAMKIYIGAYAVAVLALVYFALAVAGIAPLPGGRGSPASARAVLTLVAAAVAVLSACAVAAAALWDSAPRRAWFWPVAALPPIVWFAPDVSQLAAAFANANEPLRFAFATVTGISLIALAMAAVVSMLQAHGSRRV